MLVLLLICLYQKNADSIQFAIEHVMCASLTLLESHDGKKLLSQKSYEGVRLLEIRFIYSDEKARDVSHIPGRKDF